MSIESNNLMNLADGQVLYNDLRDRQEDIVYDMTEGLENKANVIVNSASGPIASFDDGVDMLVRDCMISIEPVQDLHGQDSPYPAGEGVNKIAWNDGIDFTLNNVRYYVSGGKLYLDGTSTSETSSLDNTFKTYFSFTLPAGTYYFTRGSYPSPAYLVHDVDGTSTRRVSNSGPFTLTEAETFWVGFSVSNNKTFSNTEAPIQIVSGSSAPTAYSPYSNICPITGWAGANLSVVGKNLFDMMAYTPSNMTFEINSGTITRSAIRIDLLEGTYTLSGNATQVSPYIHYVIESSDGSYVSGDMLSTNTDQWSNKTVTLNTGEYIILFKAKSNGILVLNDVLLQIEVGTEKTVYEPYNGHEYHVSWGTEAGTIYGGQLDVTTGELTVDRATITLDGTQAINNSSFSNTYNIVARWVIPDTKQYGSQQFPNAVCDKLKVTNSGKAGNFASWGNDSNAGYAFTTFKGSASSYAAIGLPVSLGITTNSGLNAWLSTNPITICYELATPLTYQLTTLQIVALLGQNNIWADCGDISVDYCADTKTYVDDAIPTVPVQDVQIKGKSILQNGVANIPIGQNGLGVVQQAGMGVAVDGSGRLILSAANAYQIKGGTHSYSAIEPATQHTSVFYGLAKLAGADMKDSSNSVGTYTDEAKQKIHKMLDVPGNSDVAYIESTLVAQRKYDPGDYFVDEYGILSKATAAIASGGSLVLDTNYEHIGQGGLANDFLKPVELVGSVTVEEELESKLISIPLSKPCRYLTIRTNTTGTAIPGWSYYRLNGRGSSPCCYVNASTSGAKCAMTIIDLINKFAFTLLKTGNSGYTEPASFAPGVTNQLFMQNVATEVGFVWVNGSAVGISINIYGR